MALKFSLRLLVIFLFGTLIASPYLVFLFNVKSVHLAGSREIVDVFKQSIFQSALSATLSVVFGFCGALGLEWAREHLGRAALSALRLFVLLPQFLPPLSIALGLLNIVHPFPFGPVGLIIAQVLVHSGLVAVALQALIQMKAIGWGQTAEVLGAQQFFFLWRVLVPGVKRELLGLFLFVFTLCFTSFSLPLLLGGFHSTTIEVLIFEKLRLLQDWPQALGLTLTQIIFIFVLSLLPSAQSALVYGRDRSRFTTVSFGLLFVLLPPLVIVLGLFQPSIQGFHLLQQFPDISQAFDRSLKSSFLVSGSAGWVITLLLLAFAFLKPSARIHRVMRGFIAPSAIMIGFALLLCFQNPTWKGSYFRSVCGFSLLFFPSFYRWQWGETLQALRSQWEIAETMGASDFKIFRDITLPQVFSRACFLGGIGAFWAWGDFALTGVVIEGTTTAGLIVRNLMVSYRLEVATYFMFKILIAALVTSLLFFAIGRLGASKIQTLLDK